MIRVGDKVKIKAATEFVRCGYDKTLDQVADEVYTEYESEIDKFVKTYFKGKSIAKGGIVSRKVAKALAYGVIGEKCKKGGTRRLFLKPLNTWYKFVGEGATVLETKIVKTGKLCPAYSWGNIYSDDYDYEPAYLAFDKTYKVLKVGTDKHWEDFWILAMHAEKV